MEKQDREKDLVLQVKDLKINIKTDDGVNPMWIVVLRKVSSSVPTIGLITIDITDRSAHGEES